jgi:hypothetical protein
VLHDLEQYDAAAQNPGHNLCIGLIVITVTASALGSLPYAAGNSSSALADITACYTVTLQHSAGGGTAQYVPCALLHIAVALSGKQSH